MRVGYYVHHHGRGHATRAGVLGAALLAAGHDVAYLGSGVLPALEHPARASRVVLPPDVGHPTRDATHDHPDAEAGGRLHWAPLGGGYRRRSEEIAAWVAAWRPDVVVVDVSVEVTALVRLLGVPVVVVAQPGVRDDAPHALAYDLAAAILAPWPAGLDVAPHLARHREKVAEIGGITRFARRRDAHPSGACAGRVPATSGAEPYAATPQGVLLVGGEGWDDAELPAAVRAAVPDVTWRSPSAEVPVEALLAGGDVVVTHAGQNALADVAAFEVPAVVVPQARPFGEQADMAAALDAARLAHGLPEGAGGAQVGEAVRAIVDGDEPRDTGAAWRGWQVAGAPERAAAVVESAARMHHPPDRQPSQEAP